VVAGFGLDTGLLPADLERKDMVLLWLFILIAGASPSQISQCPWGELVGSTGKIRG